MTEDTGPNPPAADTPADGSAAGKRNALEWLDVDRRRWSIELSPERIALRSGEDTVDLPASSWTTDVYVAQHGDGLIIRIETFEQTIRFLVSREAADPLVTHLATPLARRPIPAEVEKPTKRAVPLLWPKVSPLAVWAVISSALVFVPVLGLLPAVATAVLLIFHRLKVRHAAAWRHSRALCTAAFVLLIAGLLVSVLSTWGLSQHAATLTEETVFAPSEQTGRNWGVIAAGILVVLLSLSVHEAAHATTAWWLGDGLAKSLGRVTLNPLAHIDPFGTVLLPLILAFARGPIFGYARPVPVSIESLPRHHRAHILVSIAGPGSNLLLAAVSFMVLIALGCMLRLIVPQAAVTNLAALDFTQAVKASGFALAPAFGPLCTILKLSFIVNTFLAMFNLIPIPPLDGSWVLEHLFPRTAGPFYAKIRPFGFLIFLGAIYTGVFEYLIIPALLILVPGIFLLAGATGF